MTKKQRVLLEPTRAEYEALQQAADKSKLSLSRFVLGTALRAAREQGGYAYTRQELANIATHARRVGHEWTVEELRKRHLPLYWDVEWVAEQLSRGATYTSLAQQLGCTPKAIDTYMLKWSRVRAKAQPGEKRYQAAKENIRMGTEGVADICARLGISRQTLQGHIPQLIHSPRGISLVRVVRAAPYPASVQQIAERLEMDMNAAYRFTHYATGRGLLRRLKQGVYGVGERAAFERWLGDEASELGLW